MAEKKRILNFEGITNFFGLRSNIFKESINFLEKESISNREIFNNKFENWKLIFKNIYGDDIDENLFLRHTYFALILKIIVCTKLSIIHDLDLEDAYDDFCVNNLELLQVFEFEYFNWINLSRKIFKKIYSTIEEVSFTRQDLFHELYQQLIFSITRHKIGEFYTPNNLIKKMVDDVYEFGLKVLDPSCGSGSFLINIIVNILNTDNPNSLKTKAINNLYGIDINPLASITAKINIFLILLDYYDFGQDIIPEINIFLFDSLFPQKFENIMTFNIKKLYSSFDLVIGNPPWLTYKDLTMKDYQKEIRDLAEKLNIKPSSQYITHIELATVFFYAISSRFLKIGGKIFLVLTKSTLNGDHCYKFRAFSIFKNLEIWDFPNFYFLNVDHICLKAEYIGKDNETTIESKYPIKTKLFNNDLEIQKELFYSSLKIESEGAKIILPEYEVKALKKLSPSPYKSKFFQGATLVPRSLVFFKIEKKEDSSLLISSDPEIMSRAKENWNFTFHNKEIEKEFFFKTFLNKDLVPFFIKVLKRVFLPINESFKYDSLYLQQFPKALRFYNEMNEIYKKKRKKTSDILTLFDNLNYWNKLSKQSRNKKYLIVYNASGANLKAAVVHNKLQKIIIGSENYYYSTDHKEEAYYLSAIFNSPSFSEYVKLIKSSRHIHKRPFSFPIPLLNENNELHKSLSKKAEKCETIVQDLFFKNPNINSEKVRTIINHKLKVINGIVDEIVFK